MAVTGPVIAAAAIHEQVTIQDTTTGTLVDPHPRACLMYYLSCVDSVLTLSEEELPVRLTKYANFRKLSQADANALFPLLIRYSPDKLRGKVFFVNPDIRGRNRFYSVEEAKSMFAVTEDILIGSDHKRVSDVMVCKAEWLNDNYYTPMREYRDKSSGLCIIS